MRNAYSVEMGPLYLLYVCIVPFNRLILNQQLHVRIPNSINQ